MAGTLRIMTWNSNGLLQHKESLLVTLTEQKIMSVLSRRRTSRANHILNCADMRFIMPYTPVIMPGEEVLFLLKLAFHTMKTSG